MNIDKRQLTTLIGLVAAVVSSLAPITYCSPISAAPVSHKQRSRTLTTEQVCSLALPSVVELKVRDDSGEITSEGSGFVVGINRVATNWHVIEGAHKVSASFHDGRSEEVVGVVGSDKENDLAIVWVNTGNARALRFAPNEAVRIGRDVVAIGCPEGFQSTVSKGIISGIRSVGSFSLIQTDAPISHGSSGGPLLDMNGAVLGMTAYNFADAQNLNFAIPSACIRRIIPDSIVKYRPWGEVEWTPVAGGGPSVGRLGVVTAETSVIVGGTDRPGTLSTCQRGTYLSINAQTDTQYRVIMIDKSYGFISKEDVKILDYKVLDGRALPKSLSRKH